MQYRSNRLRVWEILATCFSLAFVTLNALIEGGFSTYPLSAGQSGESKFSGGVGAWIKATITSAKAETNAALPLEARTEGSSVRVMGIVKAKEAIPAKTIFASIPETMSPPVGTVWGKGVNLTTGAVITFNVNLSGQIACEQELLLNAECLLNFTYSTNK